MDAKIRDAEITTLKDIEIDENGNIKKSLANKVKEKMKINFNLLEKIYFYIRRKFESRKKSRKNY